MACGRGALGAFFDLPQRAPPVRVMIPVETTSVRAAPPTAPPPAFEQAPDPDSAVKLLPRDHAGNVDWVAAMRTGVVRPRSALPGRTGPDATGFKFAFDFEFQGPDTTFDALFPHSTHTQWLSCATCHPRVFRYRGAPIKMADVLQGKFCGECHGKVSFPVVTGCERCHTRLAMPPNRAPADLIGTIQLARAKGDSVHGGTVEGNAAGVRTEELPRAQFPHWVHRSRYLCKACHMELFVPRQGANVVTMKLIASGQACGACHDGKAAFAAGFGYCDRCHVPPKSVATGQ
jgi:c(7)-type cytochrome triheme protein